MNASDPPDVDEFTLSEEPAVPAAPPVKPESGRKDTSHSANMPKPKPAPDTGHGKGVEKIGQF